MEFVVKNNIFEAVDRLYTENWKGRFGIIGGQDNVIDKIIFPRITGGCSDSPSISHKAMAEAYIEFIKEDKEIMGFLKYFTNSTLWNHMSKKSTTYKMEHPTQMLSINLETFAKQMSKPCLFIATCKTKTVYYCSRGKKEKGKRTYDSYYCRTTIHYPELVSKQKDQTVITFYFTPKTVYDVKEIKMTDSEILAQHGSVTTSGRAQIHTEIV